jgi:hypothetical protein
VRCVAAAAAILTSIAAAHADEQVTLTPRPGVTDAVIYTPAAQPRANVVLFVGSAGVLGRGGAQNFLIRIKGDLVAAGFNVAVVDAPSDHRAGMDASFRASAEHAQDIAATIAFLKGKADLPVWLVGTSMGSISAANGGVRLGPAQVAGVELTSSVWSGGMALVPFGDLAVPVLVVHNQSDRCPSAPFAGAEQAMARFAKAPDKKLLAASGGTNAGPACEPLAPHGYYQVEGTVVPAMIDWIAGHSPPR